MADQTQEKKILGKEEEDLAKTSEIDISVDEDEAMEDARDAMIEEAVKERVDLWLKEHGTKLFALEYSKAAVKESKRTLRAGIELSTSKPTKEPGESQITSGDKTKRRRLG